MNAQTQSIMAQNPALCEAVGSALLMSDLPAAHHDQASDCAAYLYASGWVTRQRELCGDPGGWVSEDEVVETRTRDAVAELQACGVLPAGLFSWVLAVGFRWAMEAVIEHLVRIWLTEDEG